MLTSLGYGASALAVADLYKDFLDVFVLDEADRESSAALEELGIRAVVCPTLMTGMHEKEALARSVMEVLVS